MAFDSTQLKDDLYLVLTKMKTSASDDDFADGISKAVKDFGESGDVVTVDSGTVSAGTLTASGNGNLSLTDSLMSSPVKVACKSMLTMSEGGDATLATAIGTGLLTMTSAPNVVETKVNGTASTPTSTTPIVNATAKGTITCENASVISGLKDCFAEMKEPSEATKADTKYQDKEGKFDGDLYFAYQFSDLINDYFTAGAIATQGQGEISGSTGTGTIS